LKLSMDLDTDKAPLILIAYTCRADAYALHAHQDAGTAISAVRTWMMLLQPQVRHKDDIHADRWRGCRSYR
ncbi:MAG: hypothetical protein K0M60_20975, partial [Hydrogenophaga sp.]|nr:hypothetical protein [Hydrogenophaga sp.]